MKKMKMITSAKKTFEEGYEEYVLDMKSRNLRDGTIRHYDQAIKQIYKRIPAKMLIENFDAKTIPNFIIQLRDDPNLNDVSMRTYARDLKTIMRFFMRSGYLEHFEIKIPKATKPHLWMGLFLVFRGGACYTFFTKPKEESPCPSNA